MGRPPFHQQRRGCFDGAGLLFLRSQLALLQSSSVVEKPRSDPTGSTMGFRGWFLALHSVGEVAPRVFSLAQAPLVGVHVLGFLSLWWHYLG